MLEPITNQKVVRPSDLARRALSKEEQEHVHNELPGMLKNGVRLLEEVALAKNVFTLNEFLEYLPLFDEHKLATMTQEDRVDLAKRYSIRVSRYHRVLIVANEGSKTKPTDDKKYVLHKQMWHLILKMLPPQYTEHKTINEVRKNDLTVSASFNTNSKGNIYDQRSRMYDQALVTLVRAMIDQEKLKENQALVKEFYEENNTQAKSTNEAPESKNSSMDDFAWN